MANSRKSSSNNPGGRIAPALAATVPAGSSILVGLSGGVDSVALLHLLAQLAPQYHWKISALHVHHGISPNADGWAAFCAEICAKLDVPLQIERVNIEPLRALGVEAAARELRHQALARQPADFIALAHHQDDQAETLLLQLLRGAGVKGAAAMPMVKYRDGKPALLRPLLDTPRAALLEYAREHDLQWIEDESNADASYPRNFLRHRVLPLLEQRFPACAATLARSASHFAEASQLLDDLAQQDNLPPAHRPGFPEDVAGGVTRRTGVVGISTIEEKLGSNPLEISRLQSLSAPRAKNLLRWFLHRNNAPMPHAAQLDDMLRQLLTAHSDAAVCIVYGGWQVRRYRNWVYVFRELPAPDAAFRMEWHGETALPLPQLGGTLHFEFAIGKGISREKLRAARVTVQLRQGAERLRLHSGSPARTLKNLFQEYGIPPWQRERLPLLFCDEILVAVPGVGVECGYSAAPQEEGVVLRWACH